MAERFKNTEEQYEPPRFGIRYFEVADGLKLRDLQAELDGYLDVALGRADVPYDNGVMSMIEFSNAVLARLTEIEIAIQRAEVSGDVTKGDRFYRFRTGELRSAQELFSKMQDLGSRRLTYYIEGRRDN